MAKRCNCHKDRQAAVAAGMDWHEANRRYSPQGYHEHRCECPCGCATDTHGYQWCAACSHDQRCWAKRGQVGITILGWPVMAADLQPEEGQS